MNHSMRRFAEILLALFLVKAVLFGPEGSSSVWVAASLVVIILKPKRPSR